MKCTFCRQREAELHIRTVIDGGAQEFHFCRECARKLRDGFMLPGLGAAIPLNELALAVGDFLDGLASETPQRTTPFAEAGRGPPFDSPGPVSSMWM
jgi:hypothetical protein